MPVEYHDEPGRFRGTGTVFLAWDPADDNYWGYWDAMPEASGSLEEAPRTESLTEAVAWARERAPRVLVRPESDPSEYYWAGAGDPDGGDASLKRLAV
jgi:hypothetical protein